MLLVGLLAGAVQAIEPIKTLVDGEGTSLYGTTWSTAVASYVVLAAAIAAARRRSCTGRPRSSAGRSPRPALAAWPLLLLAGTVLWSFPDLIAGLLGQPATPGVGPADNVGTIEALEPRLHRRVAPSLALAVVGVHRPAARCRRAATTLPGDDPWDGHTLEWATSSPPPVGNFASLPGDHLRGAAVRRPPPHRGGQA